MAITITKALSETKLLFCINNNIVEFVSDTAITPLNAEIQIGTANPIKIIYPNPDGSFWFNFKEYVTGLINTYQLADTTIINLTEYTIYDYSIQLLQTEQATITINFVDTTTESITISPSFIFGTTDKRNYKNDEILLTGTTVLIKGNYLKYWNGLPFDFTLYNGFNDRKFYITNGSVNTDVYEPDGLVSRLFLSDGLNNTEIYDQLVSGINVLEIRKNISNALRYTLNIEMVEPCGNYYYIKFMNDFGVWQYWLFDNGSEQLTTKALGEVNNNYNDLDLSTSITKQIGKEANETFSVTTDILTAEQMQLLKPLLTSPKIYLWTGEVGVASTIYDWLEIKLTTANHLVKNPKIELNKLNLTFELPDLDTRKL